MWGWGSSSYVHNYLHILNIYIYIIGLFECFFLPSLGMGRDPPGPIEGRGILTGPDVSTESDSRTPRNALRQVWRDPTLRHIQRYQLQHTMYNSHSQMNVLVFNDSKGNFSDDGSTSEQVDQLMVSQSTNTEAFFIKVTLVICCFHSKCINHIQVDQDVKFYRWWWGWGESGDACGCR